MRLLALFITFYFCANLHGQKEYVWIDDDILDDTQYIAHVSESDDGFYWLGNFNGLVRFDGKQAKNIRIQDPDSPIEHKNTVSSRMFSDGKGKLWFTTGNAIHSYRISTGRIKTYQVTEQLIQEGEEAASNYFGVLFNERTGHLWLRAGNGLYAFSPETGKSKLLGSPVNSVSFSHHIDANGNIHVWGSSFIINNLESLVVAPDETAPRYRILESPLQFVSTTPLGDNRLLAATDRGLQEVTISGDNVSARQVSGSLPPEKCYNTSASSRPNNYWVCYPQSGVFEVDITTGNINRRILNNGGSGLRIPEYLNRDRHENLWITDRNKGLLVVPDAVSSFQKVPLDNDATISDIYQDEANYTWAITVKGNLYQINYPDGEILDRTALLGKVLPFKGRFYSVGSYWYLKGIESMHRRSFRGQAWSGVPALYSVFPGMVNAKGRPLRIAGSAISYFDFEPDILTDVTPPLSGQTLDKPFRLFPLTDSTFLAPTRGAHLVQYLARLDSSLTRVRTDTIRADIYASLRAKDGTVYLGTENGLYRYGADETVAVFNEIGPLFNSFISSIGEDLSGNLWLGTSKGLLFYNPKTEEVRRYSKEDGLPSNQFTEANAITLPDGMLYMATSEGLVSFRPEEVLANEPPIQPYLSEVWVNQLPLSTDSSLLDLRRLKLPYARNTIDLSLGLIGLQQSGLAGFTYQLLGLEDAPGFVAAGQRIKYPKLPPGEYTFEYRAINRHGKQFDLQRLPIVIVPRFTQTWTFFGLVILAVVLLLASVYAWLLQRERTRQARLREDREKILTERERIAAELHDDLGGDLASMVFIIDGHEYLREQGVASELDVRRIGNLANGAIRNMREMIWVLDDSQTTPAALAEQLLTVAREMALAAELSFQADIAEDLPAVSLTSAQKKNVLLIAKEGIQNIRKHARAQGFYLRFEAEQLAGRQQLTLEITDNGRGLAAAGNDPKKSNHGHGMTNLNKRAAAIGGTLTLTPALPAGTRMKLSLPLPHPPD